MSTATSETPARGKRPRNRRELIVNAAAALFHQRGYPHVSMGDIAEAVAVGPSALYRHFPGKQVLLAEILRTRFASFSARVAGARAATDPMTALARASLEHRDFGVLWERESRHLDDATRRELLQGFPAVLADVERIVGAYRPGLSARDYEVLAWLATGVLMSPSFQRVVLPGDRMEQLLTTMLTAAVVAPRFADDLAPSNAGGAEPVAGSRREELLQAAIALFAERGYQDVGIEDIAAAAGLTATGIYRHFATKHEVLLAAMIRGAEWLRLDLNRAIARSGDPEESLRALVTSYVGLVMDHPDLISVLITETNHLPEAERRRILQEQRSYVAEWLRLLGAVHPDETQAEARCRAQAVFTLANSCARNQRLRERADLSQLLQQAAEGALGIPQRRSTTP